MKKNILEVIPMHLTKATLDKYIENKNRKVVDDIPIYKICDVEDDDVLYCDYILNVSTYSDEPIELPDAMPEETKNLVRNALSDEELPEDLKALVKYAKENDCDYITFKNVQGLSTKDVMRLRTPLYVYDLYEWVDSGDITDGCGYLKHGECQNMGMHMAKVLDSETDDEFYIKICVSAQALLLGSLPDLETEVAMWLNDNMCGSLTFELVNEDDVADLDSSVHLMFNADANNNEFEIYTPYYVDGEEEIENWVSYFLIDKGVGDYEIDESSDYNCNYGFDDEDEEEY